MSRSITVPIFIPLTQNAQFLHTSTSLYHLCNKSPTEESEQRITTTTEEIEESDDRPWKKKSQFKPAPGKSEALKEFISELESYLFYPHNARKV